MFIEFITKRKEKFCININHILYVIEKKGCAIIVDIIGTDYEIENTYEEVMKRIYNHLEPPHYLTCADVDSKNWQNV